MNVKPEVENLARYLVNERSRVDALIDELCDPPTWDDCDDRGKARARVRAQMILAGEIQ